MSQPAATGPITYARVAAIALPVVLSNAMVPLQGAIDTAVIGNLGAASYLAAVALGSTVIHLLFVIFNFLQMGVSGLTAQALGADDRRRVMNTLVRAGIIALAVAALLIAAKLPLRSAAIGLFEGSDEALLLAGAYVDIRIWGAPAELMNYALMGWFAGQGLTRRLFEMQVVTSLVNIALNLIFVLGFGWGVEGVALGTVLAAFTGSGIGFWRVRQRAGDLAPQDWRFEWARILNPVELRQVMALNRDIMIRTLMLTGGFAWLTRLGSLQGDVVLAANGVLLQFLYLSSHALDGFALAAEALVGQALGARSRTRLRRAVVVSTVSALVLAAAIAVALTLVSGPLIRLFTNVEAVRAVASGHALWATALPLVAVLAYQFDGIFIGATEGAMMRNAMIVAAAVFFPLGYVMTEAFGNHGLWGALWVWMALRAGTLAVCYPRLEARAGPA
ncbi:MAG TPA: MATE family efflux transporter [Thermohalobaculum sp.]|nr:MATE family efflux transporter [Thermohalobaculum sp.]